MGIALVLTATSCLSSTGFSLCFGWKTNRAKSSSGSWAMKHDVSGHSEYGSRRYQGPMPFPEQHPSAVSPHSELQQAPYSPANYGQSTPSRTGGPHGSAYNTATPAYDDFGIQRSKPRNLSYF